MPLDPKTFGPTPAWAGEPQPCIVCGRRGVVCGTFFCKDPAAAGLPAPPPGKSRVYLYGLCRRHSASVDTEFALGIEEILRSKFDQSRN